MSNHCIEYICLKCGRWRCARCYQGGVLSPKGLKEWKRREQATPCGIILVTDERCCEGAQIAHFN